MNIVIFNKQHIVLVKCSENNILTEFQERLTIVANGDAKNATATALHKIPRQFIPLSLSVSM